MFQRRSGYLHARRPRSTWRRKRNKAGGTAPLLRLDFDGFFGDAAVYHQTASKKGMLDAAL